jgi:hypothetical protein
LYFPFYKKILYGFGCEGFFLLNSINRLCIFLPKTIKMKSIFLLIFHLFLLNTITFGQDLSLHLNVLNSELSKIEPLFYELELSNDSEVLKEIYRPCSTVYAPLLEFYNEKSNQWEVLKGSRFTSNYRFELMSSGSQTRNKVYLKPNAKYKNHLIYLAVNGGYLSTDYIFDDKDSVKIRAVYQVDEEGNELIYSNVVTIFFTSYSGQDSLALSYLESLSLPHFIYEKTVHSSFFGRYRTKMSFSVDEGANDLVARFPQSKFAVWAYIELVWNSSLYFERIKDVNKLKDVIVKSEAFLRKALEIDDSISRPYIKKLFYRIAGEKLSLGLYGGYEGSVVPYLEEIDYIDSL